mmetsp:Transcript_9505/g.27876  ORF Transcript_9505/g.27876 Transcript_9505/m.27876 type:complete len:214 (+) Transcript_9505:2509-3150(+)
MKRAARRVAGWPLHRSQPPALVANAGRVDGPLARARRVERRPVRVDELGHDAVLEGSELPREEVLGGQVLVVAHPQVPACIKRRQARDRAEGPRRRPRCHLGMRVVARHGRVVVVCHELPGLDGQEPRARVVLDGVVVALGRDAEAEVHVPSNNGVAPRLVGRRLRGRVQARERDERRPEDPVVLHHEPFLGTGQRVEDRSIEARPQKILGNN